MTFHILGSYSQLTNSMIFQRGVGQPPTPEFRGFKIVNNGVLNYPESTYHLPYQSTESIIFCRHESEVFVSQRHANLRSGRGDLGDPGR